MVSQASVKPVSVFFCFAAFLAAFALAMLSRSAFEDFNDDFLTSVSPDCCSCMCVSDAADVADETLDTVEDGEGILEEKFDEGFLVFLTESGRLDWLSSASDGSTKALFREGRGFDDLPDKLLPPPYVLVLAGRVSARFDGVAPTGCSLSGPRLCLAVDLESLEGVSLVELADLCETGAWFVEEEEVVDIRDLDGSRMDDIREATSSPFC